MTPDVFRARLRAVYDRVLAQSIETKRQMDAELDVLWAEVGEPGAGMPEAFGAVVNAEVVRFHEGMREAEQAARRAREG